MNVIRDAVRGLQGAAIALLMAACGGGGSGNGSGAGAPAGPAAAGTIGAAGGEVAFADGRFRLAIPAGALAAPTETTPDASSLVASTTIAAPLGCDKPAHPALFTDSEGAKGVVSCFGSNSYWVFRY